MTPNSITRIVAGALAAGSAMLAGCTDSTATVADRDPAPAAIGDARPHGGWSFAARSAASEPGWYPIHPGITVAPTADGGAMQVTYRRSRGKPAGVAFDLPAGASERLGSVALRMSAAPDQRLSVCLTDGKGVVWSFPSVKATAGAADVVLSAADLRPDPFQNGGKQVPERPDWSDMRMLTILDITGFMGAEEADCAWRIESVRGEEAER